MAAKKPKKARKTRKPKEQVIAPAAGARKLDGILEAGTLKINKKSLEALKKDLERLGIRYPKVQFVARNAPFMRRPPTPSV